MNYYLVIKRLLDFLIALTFIILLSPLIILVSIIIKLTSKGPIFYRGCRAGKDNKNFFIIKFRSMIPNAEKLGGPSTAFNDKRLTPIGHFLRSTKIDEFPQLFNVLIGDMSFVGPRPQVKYYTDKYKGDNKRILSVRPGITDYASIEFSNMDKTLGDLDVDDYYEKNIEPKKNTLRIKYVKEISFKNDLIILLKTFNKLISTK
tara:strand:+ start:2079 stop:2687 length:609 start_codon:yes stop_codon:yes gene_type:complete